MPSTEKRSKRMQEKPCYAAGIFGEFAGILSSFYALSKTINQSLDLGETLALSLESAMEILNADSGNIRLLDEETDELVLTAHRGLSPAELERMVARRKRGEGSSWQCVRSEKPLIHETPLKDSTVLKKGGIEFSITIPLKSKRRIIGTMSLHQRTGRRLLSEEIELFSHIGDQVGVAVENARLFSQLQQRTEALAVINTIAQTLNHSLDPDKILNDALEKVIELFKVDAGFLRLLSEDGQELLLNVQKGFTKEQIGQLDASRKYGDSLSWKALLDDRVRPIAFNAADSYEQQTNSFGLRIGARNAILFPLKSKDNLLGTMSIYSFKPRLFSRHEIELAAIIGNQIGVAIDNARLHKSLLDSEKKYKALFETSGDALFVLDLEGNFNLVNHAVEEISGYSRPELIGRHFKKVVAPPDLDFIQGVFDSGYDNFSKRSVEIRIVDKKGEEHVVELLKGASRLETSGETTGYLITARDLTEKKKTEEKLLQTAKLQSLGEMASGIAHDFNNILMVILGHTEMLLHEAKNENLLKKLKIIERAALDGSKTVMKIGDFTRVQPKEAEFLPVDLHAVVHSALEFTSSRWKDVYQKEGHPFELKLRLDEIPSLAGNESELREAFVNIILNSLDAMPRGGALEIETRFLKTLPGYQNEHPVESAGFVQMKVTDNGIGMDDQTRRKIFDPFFSTKGVKGLGLGLSIAYGIIKRHKGEMRVESQKGIGTSFLIYLPVMKSPSAAQKPQQAPAGNKRSARILVVDDDQTNLDFLCELLQKLGHQPVTAPDGETGLSRFKAEGPWDIVFSDLGMPGISGWELIGVLKRLDPGVPAVLITGWGFQLQEEEIKAKMVDYVLSKPFKIGEITRIIDRILQSKGPNGNPSAAKPPAPGTSHD